MEETQLQELKGKNWMAAMSLCWFLGMYGAHRFYTGKTGTAWAMAIMTLTCCLAPISAIWAMIDGIMIAIGSWNHDDGSELYERINWLGYIYIAVIVMTILYVLLQLAIFFAALGAAAGSAS